MNKLAMILATGLAISSHNAHACKDTLNPAPDKAKHFAVSVALGSASRLAINDPYAAFAVAMLPGIYKERQDAKDPAHHCASFADLAYDALGAAVGVSSTHWVIRHNFVGYRTAF